MGKMIVFNEWTILHQLAICYYEDDTTTFWRFTNKDYICYSNKDNSYDTLLDSYSNPVPIEMWHNLFEITDSLIKSGYVTEVFRLPHYTKREDRVISLKLTEKGKIIQKGFKGLWAEHILNQHMP